MNARPIRASVWPTRTDGADGGRGTSNLHQRASARARGLTTFVGRDAEMDTLFAALEQAKGGKGQLVAVVGEPGVGKSLFLEFAHSHRTDGCLVLEAASVSYGKATAYVPVVGLLSRYFQIEPGDEPRKIRERVMGKLFLLDRALEGCLAPLLWLLDVPGEDPEWERLDPPQRRHRLLDGLRRLVLRESQMQPLVLVFAVGATALRLSRRRRKPGSLTSLAAWRLKRRLLLLSRLRRRTLHRRRLRHRRGGHHDVRELRALPHYPGPAIVRIGWHRVKLRCVGRQ